MIFLYSVSGKMFYIDFSFCRLAISATRFLVVFNNFQICKNVALLHVIMTYIKENIITKLQKLYSVPRNVRAGNKSPVLLLKKPLHG